MDIKCTGNYKITHMPTLSQLQLII